jgi:tetratricopeptide (TPR) repeat protein
MPVLAMRKVLRTAIELHRSGQLDGAASLYQGILAGEPQNADALHWFGLLHHQLGDHARATDLIAQAVALKPGSYLYHGNLAEACRAAGDHQRAVESSLAALRLWPDYPEALLNLGSALTALKRPAEAVDPLRRAVELRPNFVVAINNLGIAFRELGKAEDALAQFRRAVELEPSYAPAQTNLGQGLLYADQLDQALSHCREAVRLDPDSAEMHDNLGNVLRALDRLDEAWAAHCEALRLKPDLALANAHIGVVLHKKNRFADAIPWLKRATELEPLSASIWEWLADLHADMDEPRAAIPCWERVLALEPARTAAHLSLGRALQDEGRLMDARAHYRIADELMPHSGAPQLNLGWLHELLGEMNQAEAAFRTALERQPNFPAPHGRLATLLRGKLSDEDLAALEVRLADEQLAEGPRARLLFGLAHVLDARADFTRAAECMTRANAITLELAKGRHDYFTAEHEQYVAGLMQVFDRGFFSRLTGAGLMTRRPVFVFGLPRSGTTLIEQVLASHSQIHGAGELRLARQSFEEIPALLGQDVTPRDCIPMIGATELRRLAEQHLGRLNLIDGEKSPRIVDKMPENYLFLGLLAVLFPDALFIHCRRDLRDVAVSCWMTDFSSIRWANDPSHIASRFQQYRRIMDHWLAVLPLAIHEVDYEETVNDLESVARRLIAAAGLEWEPACLEFHRTERPVRTASVGQVRQPVYKGSLERWKNYRSALAELFAALPVP